MSNKPSAGSKGDPSKSGIMPRPILEPDDRREPPLPPTVPEFNEMDRGTTTGMIPIITEGKDRSAEREDDPATRG